MCAHLAEIEDEADFRMEHTERGRVYRATSKTTGELFREYFVTCAELWYKVEENPENQGEIPDFSEH